MVTTMFVPSYAVIVAAADLERAERRPLSRDAHAEPDDELLDACRTSRP